MFQGLLLTRTDDGALKAAVTELDDAQLPPGDVMVQISHSTLDYKDGLDQSGFAITNPNAQRTCGCGQSFS